MKYEQPRIIALDSAVESIRSQQAKGDQYQDSFGQDGLATSAAYEADE